MSTPDSRGKILRQKVQVHPDGSKELWRDIPGYAGLYRVSDWGRVKSLERIVVTNRGMRTCYGKFIKAPIDKKGYAHAKLLKGGRWKRSKVHTLVLLAFIGPRPSGYECCHFPDRDRSNNSLHNLRWGTPKDNHEDSVKHGTSTAITDGAREYWASMTTEQRSKRNREAKANMTPEQRSKASRKANANRTPEQRSEIARKVNASLTPEQRSEKIRKGWITRRQKRR